MLLRPLRRSVSADGRYEVFTSSASDLVAGMSDTNGTSDVFVRDLQTGVTTLVSVNTAGTAAGNGASDSGVISADGRYVAFRSYATDLATPATDGNWNIFVRDLQTGVTTLVSVNTAGTGGANGWSTDEPTISGDGSLIAFRSVRHELGEHPRQQRHFRHFPAELAGGHAQHRVGNDQQCRDGGG